MKVAVPAEGPNFNAIVSDRLGLSPYLFIVNLESKEFEILRSPRDSGGSGTGMQMVALIIAKKSNVILTDWCSSVAEKYLSAHGVDIVTGMSGTVAEVLEKFEKNLKIQEEKVEDLAPLVKKIDRRVMAQAIWSASRQFKNLLPVMMGVVFLVGFFSVFFIRRVSGLPLLRKNMVGFFLGRFHRKCVCGQPNQQLHYRREIA